MALGKVPRSVVVLGARADLFNDVRRCLLSAGRLIDVDSVIHCDGNDVLLTNIYAVDVSPLELEGVAWGDDRLRISRSREAQAVWISSKRW